MSTDLTMGRVTPASSSPDERHSLPRTAKSIKSIIAQTEVGLAVEIQKAAHRQVRVTRLLNAAAILGATGRFTTQGAIDLALEAEEEIEERLKKRGEW